MSDVEKIKSRMIALNAEQLEAQKWAERRVQREALDRKWSDETFGNVARLGKRYIDWAVSNGIPSDFNEKAEREQLSLLGVIRGKEARVIRGRLRGWIIASAQRTVVQSETQRHGEITTNASVHLGAGIRSDSTQPALFVYDAKKQTWSQINSPSWPKELMPIEDSVHQRVAALAVAHSLSVDKF